MMRSLFHKINLIYNLFCDVLELLQLMDEDKVSKVIINLSWLSNITTFTLHSRSDFLNIYDMFSLIEIED